MRNRRVVSSSLTCGVYIYNEKGQLKQLPFFFFSLSFNNHTVKRIIKKFPVLGEYFIYSDLQLGVTFHASIQVSTAKGLWRVDAAREPARYRRRY
jgi:hypothetical protein